MTRTETCPSCGTLEDCPCSDVCFAIDQAVCKLAEKGPLPAAVELLDNELNRVQDLLIEMRIERDALRADLDSMKALLAGVSDRYQCTRLALARCWRRLCEARADRDLAERKLDEVSYPRCSCPHSDPEDGGFHDDGCWHALRHEIAGMKEYLREIEGDLRCAEEARVAALDERDALRKLVQP